MFYTDELILSSQQAYEAGTVITPFFLESREACIYRSLDLKDKYVNKYAALFSN